MTSFEKHMFVALSVCTVVMLLNIFAVTNGLADDYYSQISEWLRNLHA